MREVEDAIDRVMAGPERRSRVMSEGEKTVIAYHEAGHALVGHALHTTDPIHKVSIIARGRALGWTLALPVEDKHLRTKAELLDQMAMLLGGRTAEELVFADPSTGASDDIERSTAIAKSMVTEFGMSDALGPVRLGQRAGEVFVGKEMGHEPDYSDETANRIDAEVKRILDGAHTEATEILTTYRAVLNAVAAALIERETLDEAALAELFAPVEDWPVSVARSGNARTLN